MPISIEVPVRLMALSCAVLRSTYSAGSHQGERGLILRPLLAT